jgi:uncharacterized membrane protein
MGVDVAAYVFDGTYTAEEALTKVRAAEDVGLGWVDDVAVIKRHNSGRVSVHSTWAQDSSGAAAGGAWGALTGSLVGALAGPGGALAGLFTGGATGGLLGLAVEDSVSDPALDDLADSLKEGSSALVLWGSVDPFVKKFEDFGGKLIRTSVAEETAEKIRLAASQRR